jgi:hypothetical protein
MDSTEFNAHNNYPGPLVNFQLPVILELTINLVNFKAPKFKNIQSSLAKYKEAMEIRIITSQPIPARAASPVLQIGDVIASHYITGIKPNEYLFYAFDIKHLKEGDPIFFKWINEPINSKVNATKFKYQAPKKERG